MHAIIKPVRNNQYSTEVILLIKSEGVFDDKCVADTDRSSEG